MSNITPKTFHIDGQYLQEDARMEEPISYCLGAMLYVSAIEAARNRIMWHTYQLHLATLARYPIAGKFGKESELVEGKDFRLQVKHISECKDVPEYVAVPLAPAPQDTAKCTPNGHNLDTIHLMMSLMLALMCRQAVEANAGFLDISQHGNIEGKRYKMTAKINVKEIK